MPQWEITVSGGAGGLTADGNRRDETKPGQWLAPRVDPLDVGGGVTEGGNCGEARGVIDKFFRRGKMDCVIED